MNALLWAWLLSALGASLFFAAGSLATLRRARREQENETRSDQEERRSRDQQLETALRERDQLRATLTELEQEAADQRARNSRPPVTIDAGARGAALRDILAEETRGNGFTGAVIADGMGLIVASTGEYGDALAAYGAFLAGASAKTRDGLPLRDLRQVIIQDDHDATLTVRPIAWADDNLALVTLAPGRSNGASAGNLS